jgi:hypothetical protein
MPRRKKKQEKQDYYTLEPILKEKAHYNLIIGERSNGKTYSVLQKIVNDYAENGAQAALLRRMQEDFIGKRGAGLFEPLIDNGEIELATAGEWTSVYYYASRWFLCRYEEDKKGNTERITDSQPFMFGFALSQMEHEKGTGYPNVKTIVFDEFITRMAYLRDEFVLFMNTLSTIIRSRDDVTIFMLGNTVNKYCPYFDEMGLRHIKDMKQGEIDVYQLKHASGKILKVAVEYCKPFEKGKKSDFYFAFDNQKLEMITTGVWEIDIYPHCPYKYKPKNILFTYFIEFDREMLQCEVVEVDGVSFTFIHRKTTPLKHPDTDLVFTTRFDARPNFRRKLTRPRLDIERKIMEYYATDKIFYQDNEVGEIVRNYLLWCNK